MVAPAMKEQQRRRGRVAPIDVMEPQPLREIDPRGRAGARDIECRHGMPYAAPIRNCRWRSEVSTLGAPNLPRWLERIRSGSITTDGASIFPSPPPAPAGRGSGRKKWVRRVAGKQRPPRAVALSPGRQAGVG